MLENYALITGQEAIDHLRQLAEPLRGMKVVHVNSTRLGGGVAEILTKLVPFMVELGINASWEVITGDNSFFQCTKNIHNALQGNQIQISNSLLQHYENTNISNAERLRPTLEEADFVFIHDPQPAPLLKYCSNRRGKWLWRCHINASHPYRPIWKFLKPFLTSYDASIFSLAAFARALPHPEYIIPPSIDPLSDKNIDLEPEYVDLVCQRFFLERNRPLLLQVSRFDRFKDPIGVLHAYQLASKFIPSLQLVLAGGTATDDPEGEIVLEEVKAAAADDPNVHVLQLPPDDHLTINALQRSSDIVLQKSTKEGFGLTVTEGMWKGKPVIGGNTGGIRLQVINYHTGFLVNTPEGAALRIRYLLKQPEKIDEMGKKAKEFVLENFLITRQLREYLTLMVALFYHAKDRIELQM